MTRPTAIEPRLEPAPHARRHIGAVLAPWVDRAELVHADYRSLGEVLDARHLATVDGTLADLGVSSLQFDAAGPKIGREWPRIDEAARLFEQVSLADEFVDFLTLPAYELLD